VPGALAYFYLSGTTTPQEVYTTAAGDVAHPIPLEADAEGVFPPIFSAVALKCTVTDASGNVLPGYPVDPVAIIPTGSGASSITFDPTGDIPETNVQSAIERVQLNLVEPLLAGGIGVTGNSDTLANIDATNTPSGAYRFTTGATGTFPAGVTAAAGGTIRLWRETAAEAVMELVARGAVTKWVRTLASGAWGAWGRVPVGVTATANQIDLAALPERNLSATGYIVMAGGFIMQWGTYSLPSGGGSSQVITFPIAFPTSIIAAYVGNDGAAADMIGTVSRSVSGMTVIKGADDPPARTGFWLAIGN
jgi:hypothetical protein